MNRGISYLSMIPVRKEPMHQSEMVTQILFGETFEILRTEENWLFIRIIFDQYEGWIERKVGYDYKEKKTSPSTVISKPFIISSNTLNGQTLILPAGSEIRSDANGYLFAARQEMYEIAEENHSEVLKADGSKIVQTASQFLLCPYLWGGRTFLGIDCSGLSQLVYKIHGIVLPRDASDQVNKGKTIEFIDDVHAGDLAFFDNPDGKIIHVGILTGNGKIIHASGYVRIDKIDHQGIFDPLTDSYSHKLRIMKRIL